MDINSLVTGFSMGKKKGGSGGGGKEPILTELTVTENGVYDEPTVEGDKTITWDGVVGDRVTTSIPGTPYTYVKVSDVVLSADDLDGATGCTHGSNPVVITADMLYVAPGGVLLPEALAVSVSDVAAFAEAASATFPETGMYFATVTGGTLYMESLTFPASTPADGWNKVTVNVAGDIIDVPELPTENIEEGKIYRVIEKQEMAMWIAGSMGEDQLSMAFPEFIEWAFGMTLATPTHVVEVLPDVMDAVDRDNASYPVYIVESTGIGYCSFDGTSSDIITFGGLLEGLSDNGWVDSVDDIDMSTPLGVFFIRPKSSTTYGIPNAHPVKRLVDGEWIELT